jgi:hypothetical protein
MGMDEPMAVLPGRGVAAWNVFIAAHASSSTEASMSDNARVFGVARSPDECARFPSRALGNSQSNGAFRASSAAAFRPRVRKGIRF